MHTEIKSVLDEYVATQHLDGATDEEIKLHTSFKTIQLLNRFMEESNYNIMAQNKILTSIKRMLIFWVVLTIIGIVYAIYLGIQASYLF